MKKLHSRVLIYVCISILMISCNSKDLNPNQYVAWLRDASKGLLVEKQLDAYIFKLQYKPSDYMALIESKGDNLTPEDFQNSVNNYKGLEYYDFGISVKNSNKEMLMHDLQSPADYFTKADYMAFRMQPRISLVVGSDTLPCKLYHFERNYNTSPDSHFSLGFEVSEKNTADRKLIYNDEILGVNQIELVIKDKSIAKIPHLNYTH